MVVLSCKPWPRAFAEGVGKDAEVNAIFGEPLRVLGHDALFEPIRNLLHRGHQGPIMMLWAAPPHNAPCALRRIMRNCPHASVTMRRNSNDEPGLTTTQHLECCIIADVTVRLRYVAAQEAARSIAVLQCPDAYLQDLSWRWLTGGRV